MKYCRNCRRWNPGSPQRCGWCQRSFNRKFCRSGHENPPTVLYCLTCGSAELSEPAGREPLIAKLVAKLPPAIKWGLIILVAVGLLHVLVSIDYSYFAGFIIALLILLFILRWVLQLPVIRFLGRLIRVSRRVRRTRDRRRRQ